MLYLAGFTRSRLSVPPVHTLEARLAVECRNIGPGLEGDVRARFNPGYQVSRHGVSEARPAYQQINMLREPRQEHGSLAGRIPSSDNRDFLAAADLGLDWGRSVVNAGAFELHEFRQIHFSILGSGRHNDAARPN